VTMGFVKAADPLCHLYFFSCNSKGGILSIHPQVKKVICEFKEIEGFSFVRETSKKVRYSVAKDMVEKSKGMWGERYPNAAIIRHDGIILDVLLPGSMTLP